MIKIEFPADRLDIARAMAKALHRIGYGGEESAPIQPEDVPSMSTETARQLAEDLSTEETEVVHTNPKPPAESLFDGPSAGTAAVAEEAGTDQATTQPEGSPAGASGGKVDEHGVAFNAAYCGQAAEPFYATGKTRGQWKKKKGVDQGDYDAWYTAQLETAPKSEGVAAQDQPSTVNAGAAFGAPPTQDEPETGPADAGELMVWVSEKQAAGALTQDDVNQAWHSAGVASPAELFGPNAATAVAAVYQFLNAKVQ